MHISDNDFELYALHQADDPNAIEAHLLICESCRRTVDKIEGDIRTTRRALRANEEPPSSIH